MGRFQRRACCTGAPVCRVRAAAVVLPPTLRAPAELLRAPATPQPNLQVVAEHLFHEGLFDTGRLFVREAGVEGGEALQRPYASMHTVLQEVRWAALAALPPACCLRARPACCLLACLPALVHEAVASPMHANRCINNSAAAGWPR